jgi:hypothetical protein
MNDEIDRLRLNDGERLMLNKMIRENNPEDIGNKVKQLKHSQKIKDDVELLIRLREEYKHLPKEEYDVKLSYECNFLFMYYTDIYNVVKKNEVDIVLLMLAIELLRRIEEGEIDAQEGGAMVGKALSKMYIDSAVKKSEKMEQKENNDGRSDETNKNEVNLINPTTGAIEIGSNGTDTKNTDKLSWSKWKEMREIKSKDELKTTKRQKRKYVKKTT